MDRTMDNKPMDKMQNKISNSTPGREAKNLMSDARSMMSDVAGKIESKIPADLNQKIDSLRKSTEAALNRTEALVKKYPFYSVLGAAAVGLIVAKMFSSRSEKAVYEQ